VVHTALPGTLEGYSQEIGRAGRDGRPSRAVLLHSWNDRRTHEYFFEKGYPDPDVLARVFRALGPEPRPAESLPRTLRMEPEVIETALEKLWIHGGARFSTEGGQQLVARGDEGWLDPYRRQRQHRHDQLDQMQRFADGHACRMVALVRHFGDQEDRGQPCGTCDVCAPDSCLVRTARAPRPDEREAAQVTIEALRRRDGQATGRLHAECGSVGLDRRAFEEVLGGLARAGLLRVTADSFVKDGRTIPFQRAWLTGPALKVASTAIEFTLAADAASAGVAPGRRRIKSERAASSRRSDATPDTALVAALKQWRLAEAKRARVPAFRVLHDRTLVAIAAARPRDEEALLAVPGMGPALLKRYGSRLLALCRDR
jgi:DNA topoisomerase-3